MAIIAAHYNIGTVATMIVPAHDHIQQVLLHNHEHSSSGKMFVDGPGVTINNGLHLPDTETISINVAADDALWAIDDTNSQELHVLISRL